MNLPWQPLFRDIMIVFGFNRHSKEGTVDMDAFQRIEIYSKQGACRNTETLKAVGKCADVRRAKS